MNKTIRLEIVIALFLSVLLISACSQQEQNLTKQQILRVANDVDEIRVQRIDYSRSEQNPPYELRVVHRYVKNSADFRQFLVELKNSADKGSYARAIGDTRIILRGDDKILMKLGGYSGSGQFAWSELEGMQSRRNHVYLLPTGRQLVK